MINRLTDTLLNTVYPKRCPLCDGLLKRNEPLICRRCAADFSFIKGRTCKRCGRLLKSLYEEECFECLKHEPLFDVAFGPFKYTGDIRESLVRFKYHGRAEYASFYAKSIWAYGERIIKRFAPDVIINVPVYRKRLAARGYDQAYLIAYELSKVSGIKVYKNAVKRIRNTTAQKELGSEERRRNIKGAFELSGKADIPKRVLLIDDILTTGRTADAVCRVLKEGGAEHICLAVAAVS